MMSCGTWNERESKCVLSMRVVGFFEWGRVLYYTGHRYLPCRYWWLWLDSWLKTAGWVALHGQGFHGGHTHYRSWCSVSIEVFSSMCQFAKLSLTRFSQQMRAGSRRSPPEEVHRRVWSVCLACTLWKGCTPPDDRSDTWQDECVSFAGLSNVLLFVWASTNWFLIWNGSCSALAL